MIKKIPDQFWFPFWVDKWIFGSMRLEFNPEERSVWVDLMALAAKDNGYIRANEETPYLIKQLAGILVYDEDFFLRTIEKFIKSGKLQRDKNSILYITNWEKYKLSDSYKRVLKHRKILPKKDVETKNVSGETGNITHIISNHNKSNHNKSDKEKALSPSQIEERFKEFWEAYPAEGRHAKKESSQKFNALCKRGELEEFRKGFEGYMDFLKHERIDNNFEQRPMYAKTFLNGRWKEFMNFKYTPKL